MRVFTVSENQAGKRIDKVIREAFPHMPQSAMHKAFRKKDIKANGVRVKDDYVVSPGDKLEIYIVDEILDGAPLNDGARLNKGFSVVYEDMNLLIVNKQQGVPVHPDREQSSNTLIDMVQEYLKQKGEFNEKKTSSFPPSLCHRLDRNTGGLVMIARNNESLRILLEKIKNNEVKKYYQCLVKGKMPKQQDELRSYLIKDENKSRVFISDTRTKGSVEIITRYRVLSYRQDNDTSLLEVELVTGRTHQIRAHLSHIGHQIVGDGKYGSNAYNRSMGAKYQALWACRIVFDFSGNSGILNYLKGKRFEVEAGFSV